MKTKSKTFFILKFTLLFFVTVALFSSNIFAAEIKSSDPNQSSKYLDAVRTFADNVLKYGRDTYGPKHTPLFVDGLNIHTHEPVKWVAPNTETTEWILSDFASQQTLLRTLDGLSAITADPKYRDAAMQATRYAFANLQTPNGLLYWGYSTAYDAQMDKPRGESHCVKLTYPYYELMWKVDPESTKKLVEALWSAHILNWSDLDMNRISSPMDADLEEPWQGEYNDEGPTFFKSESGAIAMLCTATSLVQAGANLYEFSDDQQPLIWSKRLINRYVQTRHPKTGIACLVYNYSVSPLGDDLKEHFNDPRVCVFPSLPFEEMRYIYWPENVQISSWLSLLFVGDLIGEKGEIFTQWTIEELTAWGKASYRKRDNVFVPILSDGTNIEGYVAKQSSSYAPAGAIASPLFADLTFFWGYTTAYRATSDVFMWQMARDIAKGNNLGDIGEDPRGRTDLSIDTTSADVYGLLGFLELYTKTNNASFLQIAQRIGDNILASKFNEGFFVPSKKHLYTRFDCFEPLALLHLYVAAMHRIESIPQVWPNCPLFVAPYRYEQEGIDRQVIYPLTESSTPPLSLQEAATIGDVNAVSALLIKGVGVDSWCDSLQKTALQCAAANGHKEIVELLIAKGARIDAQDDWPGGTALIYAAENGYKEVVKLLLQQGADVNARIRHVQGKTALMYAVENNHRDIAELLIDNGADIDAKDERDTPALFYAIVSNNMDMMKLLIDKGADVNYRTGQRQYTPLFFTVWMGNLDMIGIFIDHGAELEAKDSRGWTAFRYAVESAKKDIVELFVNKGMDVSNFYRAACVGDLVRVKALVAQGADINAKDEQGWTPLYWAASMGQEEVAEFLINNGAQADVKTNDGQTPLYQAASVGAYNLVTQLVSKGADVNVQNSQGNTPLHEASFTGHRAVAEFLIDNGANIEAKGSNQWTPLHAAAYGGHKDVVGLLLAKGVDVNVKDSRGRTPLQLTEQRGHTEIVELLTKHEAEK